MAPIDLAINTGQSSPRQRRSHSISSDRPSLTGYGGLLSPPSAVSPDPAFIAASAASQIVTNDHDSQADAWFDQHGIEPSGETALVSPPALKLVNRFLDQLLFNFLSVSRSTSLASLRPAVAEVLKPKLAKGAIDGADQELHEYLGGGEEEELLAFHNGLEPSGDWDLELVWKRTRLRCMVYSSLGDMEEEDEDYYTEQEQLDGPPGSTNRFSNNPGVVSPAVAIFLTSILEFMGEQVLVVAGQAAYHKLRTRHEKEEQDGTSTPADIAERVVVEDTDMEKVALDRTLGRLWRGWKKRIRSPTTSVSLGRTFSRESLQSQPYTSRAASMTPEQSVDENARRPSLAAVLAEHEHAATIPLPMNDNDVREIEIPGLAAQSDDEDEEDASSEDEGIAVPPRPKSMIIHHAPYGLLTPNASQPQTPTFLSVKGRKRSNSLPSPAPSIYTSPKRVKPTVETTEETENAASEKIPVSQEAKDEEMVDGNTAPAELEEEKALSDESKEPEKHSSMIAGVVAGATAIGAAAVAGIVAVAHGQAPQTDPVADVTDVEDESEAEEPQILTSSRVSLPPAGRISPEENDPKVPSRRSSVRSTSVHSLRLIDVGPARSPGMSRAGSVDAADYVGGRPVVVSRPASIHSPVLPEGMQMTPRVGSPISRGPTASPIARNGSAMSARHTRNSLGDSISEVEERETDEFKSSPTTAVPSELASAMQGVDIETSPNPYQSTQFASDSPGRDNTKGSAFVLSAPPVSRHLREISPTDLPLQSTTSTPLQPTSAPSIHSRTHGAEIGVPPLTPLREMTEGTQDAAGDSNSVDQHNIEMTAFNAAAAPGRAARIIPDDEGGYYTPGLAETNQAPYQPRPYINPRNQDPWKAKAAAQKALEQTQRPIHTSGSGSSSASSRLKALRTSEDSTQKEDKGQSFEQLIRSDQTIQYTLTPQNMRDIESPDSPRYAAPPTLPTAAEGRPTTGRSHSSSVSKYTNGGGDAGRSVKSPFKPIPRPSSNTGSRQRQNAPQPREARAERDSVGDFAEFIRSTGPTNLYGSNADVTPARSTSAAHRGINGTARNMSGSTMPTAPAAAPVNLPRRSESSAGRVRLQARDAAVPRGHSISDLIDFVRSGPQLDKEDHRIPRTVAPFRTTMDSDQMSGAVGGKAIDASLADARYSQATGSAEGSITSQIPLIKASNNVNKPLPVQNNYNTFEEEDRMPKRKTRRVRDPYAIDLSDEDEEEFAAVSNPKPAKEESLADFLRNAPPPAPEPSPIFENVSRPTSNKTKSVKKKSSTPSLMSRFGRSNSSTNVAQMKSTEAPPPLPKAPLYTPIAAKYSTTYGKTPTADTVSNGDSSYARQVDTARGKVVQKRYEPRAASYSQAPRTNELADFFMRSDPPSALSTQPQTFAPTLQKEERGSLQRMFGRKKIQN
ncbi:uncharacterized protein LY89DRAFT_156936 [Mollisia scopiformis]|uniref:Uncharacterized protein n=1 Tax=Mollisia scopiformis TaxID=149040 RepID=A0A194WZE7_MOLSC|nr:uncharacterized protein LY89DRAFT_156936 [Mollisia scopiformis]KUJ13320.1 hypothetical protein LY89DRAFT_156936 [Mollisia scopiformis]